MRYKSHQNQTRTQGQVHFRRQVDVQRAIRVERVARQFQRHSHFSFLNQIAATIETHDAYVVRQAGPAHQSTADRVHPIPTLVHTTNHHAIHTPHHLSRVTNSTYIHPNFTILLYLTPHLNLHILHIYH